MDVELVRRCSKGDQHSSYVDNAYQKSGDGMDYEISGTS